MPRQGWHLAEILSRNDVRAATARIRVYRLAIREHDDGKDGRDDARRWGSQTPARSPLTRMSTQNLFGCVGTRRQRIGRQDGEAGEAREPFVVGQMRRDWLADDEPLDLREDAFFRHTGPLRMRAPAA